MDKMDYVLEKYFDLSQQLEEERYQAFSRESLQTFYWTNCISVEKKRVRRLKQRVRLLRQYHRRACQQCQQANEATRKKQGSIKERNTAPDDKNHLKEIGKAKWMMVFCYPVESENH